MLNKYKLTIFIFFLGIIICIRLISIFSTYPGNAPDEIGHMSVIVSLANAKIMTLDENMSSYSYPYTIYNPLGYLPSILAIRSWSFLDPSVLLMNQETKSFTKKTCFIARTAQLFWFFIFLFFLFNIKQKLQQPYGDFFFFISCLIPQLSFVQSYVNLDSMGLTIMTYMVWAGLNGRNKHLAFSSFLIVQCKLNFYCFLPLPFFIILLQDKENNLLSIDHLTQATNFQKQNSKTVHFINFLKHFYNKLKPLLIYYFCPLFLGCYWFIINFFFITGKYKSFLGFDILKTIYNFEPAKEKVFSSNFFFESINSILGNFGYMNQPFPLIFYRVWQIFILFSVILFILCLIRKKGIPLLNFLALMIISLNLLSHYWGSYTGSYQPQGRYLFPSVLILICFFVYGVSQFFKSQKIKQRIFIFFISFFVLSSGAGLYYSSKNPYNIGFEIKN